MLAALISNRYVAAAAVCAALVCGLLWYRGEAISARADAERATAALAASEAALAEVRANAARNEAALTASARAAQDRADRAARIRTAIYAAPNSSACVSSEPVRAALDGLRASRDANRAADRAAGPADLPPRP